MDGYFTPSLAILEPKPEGYENDSCEVFDLHGYPRDDVPVPYLPDQIYRAYVTWTDDAVFIVGGRDDETYVASCYKLDLKNITWSRMKDLITARMFHTASVVNNSMIVAGGFGPPGDHMLYSTELYDISSDFWINVADHLAFPPNVMFPGVTSSGSCEWRGKFVVASYRRVYVYDPSTNTWSYLAELVQGRDGQSLCVCNDQLFVVGGSNSIERFDEDSGCFVIVLELPEKSSWSNTTAMRYKNEILHTCGFPPTNTLKKFNVISNELTEVTLMLDEENLNSWDTKYPVLIYYRSPPRLQDLVVMAVRHYLHGLRNHVFRISRLPLPQSLKEKLLPARHARLFAD